MLTDAEIDSLAREVFDQTLKRFGEWSPRYLYDVDERSAAFYGEPGNFRFVVVTLPIIRRVIRECDELLDKFNITERRDEAIQTLAAQTALHLISSLGERASLTVEDSVADCNLIAEAMISGAPGRLSKRDVRPLISRSVKTYAARKRAFLRDQLRGLPNLTIEGPGRPPVTPLDQERERQRLLSDIERAYRALFARTGRKPKKKEVALELGIGGLNLQGGETLGSAFYNRLKRLEIDYTAFVASIDLKTSL